MLLIPYVALSALGFGLFLLGSILDYTGVASVGAVVVIAVGAAVTLTSLETVTGAEVDKEYTTINNETVVDSTTTQQTTDVVSPLRQFGETGPLSLGALQMLVGGLVFARRLNEGADL